MRDFLYEGGIEFKREKRGWRIKKYSRLFLAFLIWLFIRGLEKKEKFKEKFKRIALWSWGWRGGAPAQNIPYIIGNVQPAGRDPPCCGREFPTIPRNDHRAIPLKRRKK